MISINNVSFKYPTGRFIFSNFSLTIERQSWTVISGPEGAGKSTLAKLIKGILVPSGGLISFNFDGAIRNEEIGYISGDASSAIIGITVLDDICFGMENLQTSRIEMKRRLHRVLNWTGLKGSEHRLTNTLSGGERQKLALAGILAIGAKILILDESFSMLDCLSRLNIRYVINNLRKTLNLTVIEIANRAGDIAASDQVVFLGHGGKLEFQGPPMQFVSSSLGSQWLSPLGGTQSLLSLFSGEDAGIVERLLISFDLRRA
jgi:energy-coupling factor transport system ATP-binding protein